MHQNLLASWMTGLMSFSGRATRKTMICTYCMLLIFAGCVGSYGTLWWWPARWMVVISGLGLTWIYVATVVRRLHDVGRSGIWFFALLTPVTAPIATLLLCCLPGNEGGNPYGEDPRTQQHENPPWPQRLVACVSLSWMLLIIVSSGADMDSTGPQRWVEFQVMVVLPAYLLWLPWWLWKTFRGRHSTGPLHSWLKRLSVAGSVTWLVALMLLSLGAQDETQSDAGLVFFVFGVFPLALLWSTCWLWRKFRPLGRAA